MHVDTKTGIIKLLKRERETLASAKTILLAIAKHGDGANADSADGAADAIGNIQASFCEEPTHATH